MILTPESYFRIHAAVSASLPLLDTAYCTYAALEI